MSYNSMRQDEILAILQSLEKKMADIIERLKKLEEQSNA
jgi:hypothetical protein